tara:strand:- start:7305 stop:8717 length:1413 start_codon:yes stop_codon:yes gene_type:complete
MKTPLLLCIAFLSVLSLKAQFGPEQLISLDHENASIAIPHDLDNDGFVDIISGAFGGKIVWHRNLDGNGTFGNEQLITSGAIALEDMQLADFDGDTDMDIIYRTNLDKVAWLENEDGMGGFGTEKLIVQNEYPYNIRVGDLDGDGDIDVLAVHNSNSFQEQLVWYENMDGAGTFSAEKFIALDTFNRFGITVNDLDEDGDKDIIAATWDLAPSKIKLYKNDGNGNFETVETLYEFDSLISDSYKINDLIVTDINNDGTKDFLITTDHDEALNYVGWLRGVEGSLTFNDPVRAYVYNDPLYLYHMEHMDLDNDGDQDLLLGFATATNYGNFSYLINGGSGNYSNPVIASEDIERTSHVTGADIDNDNDIDAIVCSSFGQRLAWYPNNGNLLNINESAKNTSILYPNPTHNNVYFNTSETITSVRITTISGKVVKTVERPSFITISELSKGMYFFTLTSDTGKISVEKIIKE